MCKCLKTKYLLLQWCWVIRWRPQCRMTRRRSCGRGRRRRPVYCRDTVQGHKVSASECQASDRPQVSENCRVACGPKRNRFRYRWRRGQWSRVKYPKNTADRSVFESSDTTQNFPSRANGNRPKQPTKVERNPLSVKNPKRHSPSLSSSKLTSRKRRRRKQQPRRRNKPIKTRTDHSYNHPSRNAQNNKQRNQRLRLSRDRAKRRKQRRLVNQYKTMMQKMNLSKPNINKLIGSTQMPQKSDNKQRIHNSVNKSRSKKLSIDQRLADIINKQDLHKLSGYFSKTNVQFPDSIYSDRISIRQNLPTIKRSSKRRVPVQNNRVRINKESKRSTWNNRLGPTQRHVPPLATFPTSRVSQFPAQFAQWNNRFFVHTNF